MNRSLNESLIPQWRSSVHIITDAGTTSHQHQHPLHWINNYPPPRITHSLLDTLNPPSGTSMQASLKNISKKKTSSFQTYKVWHLNWNDSFILKENYNWPTVWNISHSFSANINTALFHQFPFRSAIATTTLHWNVEILLMSLYCTWA